MPTSEVRTQIYLPRKVHGALRRAARARGVSMAQIIREAAEETLRREDTREQDPLSGLIGVMKNAPADLSVNHDHYLYGSPRKRR